MALGRGEELPVEGKGERQVRVRRRFEGRARRHGGLNREVVQVYSRLVDSAPALCHDVTRNMFRETAD